MTRAGDLSVEQLANGLFRVFDYGAKWTVLYEMRDGALVFRGGSVDRPDYREAVTVFLREASAVGQIATAVPHDHGSLRRGWTRSCSARRVADTGETG